MYKFKASLISLIAICGLSACGGGSSSHDGNYSTGGSLFSHSELAEEFVYRVNVDLGYDVELVKTHTEQSSYIVVYDYDYQTYDAYYIGAYNPGENLNEYLNDYNWDFYYDLIPETGNTYFHEDSGLVFSKTQASGKNLTTMKAFAQDLAVQKAARSVRAQYGLSEDKAMDVARFAYKLETSPEGTYKAEDFDKFSKELVGSSISEFQNDIKEGNASSLTRRIEEAAQATGMGPEAMNALIEDMFL